MKSDLPSMSIITPSLNQGSYIEKTVRSVLDQNYPRLEYWVVDGHSTDGTMDILRRYDGRLSLIREADQGQSAAINKGLRRSAGEILAFLNSDDLYTPGALHAVGSYFAAHPDAMWLTGWCLNIDGRDRTVRRLIRLYKIAWLSRPSYPALLALNYVSQPATFWRRKALEEVGYLDENLHFALDYDYWLRLGRRFPLHVLHRDLACYRIHAESKSGSPTHLHFDEELRVARNYSNRPLFALHRIHRRLNILIYRWMMGAA